MDLEQRHWTRTRAKNDEQFGLNRNCALFKRLAYWAYDNVTYHREHSNYQQWMDDVLCRAESFNTFPQPLPYGEIKATAKSVGKWVWVKYWPEPGKKQVQRGAMANTFLGNPICCGDENGTMIERITHQEYETDE